MCAPLNDLLDRLEDDGLEEDVDALFEAFVNWAETTGRPLYPHQEEAFLELLSGNHVIAQTPTGSGKSLIALAGHFISLARGGRSYYTAPLKALVSEKFFELVDAFGAANVGMITGDVSLNPLAPIICCTAEILANQSLREGTDLDADLVVMDEFHFYADPQRGWAWQIPLLELQNPQFVALSATLGDTGDLQRDLTERTGRAVSEVTGATRPVPLEYEYSVDELPVVVERLVSEGRAPIYIVHFAQREAVSTAKSLERTPLISKQQRESLKEALKGETFGRGFGQTLRGLLQAGIGVHHAGMLPRYRRLVERLTQRGLLAIICGTDTLGVGINVPIRTVLFTSLVKFDGRRSRHLSAREFHQIAGRAGRAGYDTVGYVRVLASESEVEQAKHRARLTAAEEAKDSKRLKKLARKGGQKPATKGKVSWNKATFERLVESAPETLRSQFAVNHAMVLNVLAGPGDPEKRLLQLATSNHDAPEESNRNLRSLGEIYRSLRQAEIVDRLGVEEANERGVPRLQVARDLPDDFALNQPLAPFALAALELLDGDSPNYALDVISVIESVMEDPTPLLWAQQRRERDQAFHAMKADGVEFDERQAALEEVTWPMPLKDIIEPAFRTFAATNPWVGGAEPSPKSVLREMVENAQTFTELVAKYDLHNVEGVILRYLTDLYRALKQIPPLHVQTDELNEIVNWLERTVRSVDSSLLDEWESLNAGERRVDDAPAELETAYGTDPDGNVLYTKNRHLLRKHVRSQMFKLVEDLNFDRIEQLEKVGAKTGWDEGRWGNALDRYWAEYDWMGIDHAAKSEEFFTITEKLTEADLSEWSQIYDHSEFLKENPENWWKVEQTIVDPNGDGDWRIVAALNLQSTLDTNAINLSIIDFSPHS